MIARPQFYLSTVFGITVVYPIVLSPKSLVWKILNLYAAMTELIVWWSDQSFYDFRHNDGRTDGIAIPTLLCWRAI